MELVAYLMDLRQIRHVLIEDNDHRLVGIVSYRSILRLMAQGRTQAEAENMPVSEVMERNPVTVAPETTTLEAIREMRSHKVSRAAGGQERAARGARDRDRLHAHGVSPAGRTAGGGITTH